MSHTAIHTQQQWEAHVRADREARKEAYAEARAKGAKIPPLATDPETVVTYKSGGSR